jgi:hypothetical protein
LQSHQPSSTTTFFILASPIEREESDHCFIRPRRASFSPPTPHPWRAGGPEEEARNYAPVPRPPPLRSGQMGKENIRCRF